MVPGVGCGYSPGKCRVMRFSMDYENVEDFLRFVAIKAHGKAHMIKVGG